MNGKSNVVYSLCGCQLHLYYICTMHHTWSVLVNS